VRHDDAAGDSDLWPRHTSLSHLLIGVTESEHDLGAFLLIRQTRFLVQELDEM